MSEVNPIEAVAKAIAAELARQDGVEDASWEMEPGLKLAFLDQNDVDMGLIARAALTSLSENITVEMEEAGQSVDGTITAKQVFIAMLNQAVKEQGQ